MAKAGNDLVAPCGMTKDCCDLGNGAACPAPTVTPSATPSDAPTARLSECEVASYVQIFTECIPPDETYV